MIKIEGIVELHAEITSYEPSDKGVGLLVEEVNFDAILTVNGVETKLTTAQIEDLKIKLPCAD